MEEWLNKPEDIKVSIPKDEEVQPDTEEETNSTETGVDEPDVEEGLKELTPEEYQKLQSKLYAIGSEANKSIVTVTGVTSDVDWFNTPYERQGQASGVIIADTGQELLIMTERKVISGAKSIHVTFLDYSTVEAELKNYGGNGREWKFTSDHTGQRCAGTGQSAGNEFLHIDRKYYIDF